MLRQPIRSERFSFCFRGELRGYFPSFFIRFHGGEDENYIVFPRWFLFNNKILSRDFIHEPSLVVDSSPAFHYLHDFHQSSRLGTFNLKFQIFFVARCFQNALKPTASAINCKLKRAFAHSFFSYLRLAQACLGSNPLDWRISL